MSNYADDVRKSITIGLNNRLKARGLEDSTDEVAVQAVCDQFAAEINEKVAKDGVAFDKRWEFTVADGSIWIGFEGDGRP